MTSTKCKIELQDKVGYRYLSNVKINNKPRRCKNPECDKLLSIYNQTNYCFNCQKKESPMFNY